MFERNRFFRLLVLPVVAVFLLANMPVQVAQAGLVPTERVVDRVAVERAGLVELLERDEVQRELIAQGVDPEEARQRIDALSDEEVVQLAGLVADEPAGQALGAVIVGLVVGILIVVLFRVVDL